MVTFIRYAEKFENIAGSVSYTFPLERYEYHPTQEFRQSWQSGIGSDYVLLPSTSPLPAEPAEEVVSFKLYGATPAAISTALDDLISKLRSIGLGKLFTIDDAGTRRWCYAQLAQRPDYVLGIKVERFPIITLMFTRFSDWFAAAATTGSQKVDASAEAFNITNAGNAPVKFIVFRFRADSATGVANPNLVNGTNSYSFGTTRDLTNANHELRVDTERNAVEYSVNNGASYANDYALFTPGGTQHGFMRLEPGVNSMTATSTGTPDYTLEWSFYATYY